MDAVFGKALTAPESVCDPSATTVGGYNKVRDGENSADASSLTDIKRAPCRM